MDITQSMINTIVTAIFLLTRYSLAILYALTVLRYSRKCGALHQGLRSRALNQSQDKNLWN